MSDEDVCLIFVTVLGLVDGARGETPRADLLTGFRVFLNYKTGLTDCRACWHPGVLNQASVKLLLLLAQCVFNKRSVSKAPDCNAAKVLDTSGCTPGHYCSTAS